ncbi:uncharacterized protein MELLADRAFT_107772 [Melampsora larici-populina 98AG31]|uniref:Secreted protein n=1 Tax=Melampsora larici-populina (strain 98AG31 / pathotype 3-4-7) TaxID=747676 RepID=F4RQW4_MELLP|nr:uncharacterized protein MELLADRAFT_107772 [Melampsora larici-populina 98AG31]EGG05111.1 secreted protein [Melampsora larici-populina 98AG31]
MTFSLQVKNLVWAAVGIVVLLVTQVQSQGRAICQGALLKGYVTPNQRLLPPMWQGVTASGSGQCLSSKAFALGTQPNFAITSTGPLTCADRTYCPNPSNSATNPNTAICEGNTLKGYVTSNQRLLPPNWQGATASGSGQCLSSNAFAIGTQPNFEITASSQLRCGNGPNCP